MLKKQKLPRKAIFLLENVPSHPDTSDCCSGEIKAIFLHLNVTSLILPLDKVILEAIKRNYWQRFFQIIIRLDEEICITEALKNVTVKKCC